MRLEADERAERSRLRTEELTYMQKAIETLGSPDAHRTFESSVSSFNQLNKVLEKALRADAAAEELIKKTIFSLSAFYKNIKFPRELVRKKEPEYSFYEDNTPDTSFSPLE